MNEPNHRPCPHGDTLQALAQGALSDPEIDSLQTHLEVCGSCQSRLERFSRLDDSERLDIAASLGDENRGEIEALRPVLKSLPIEDAIPLNTRPESTSDHVTHLGPYEVLEEIARGGMGVVLKAWDRDLQRVVAIKQLSPALAADDGARARFIREARAVAALDHENILPIFAVETHARAPYLVMPYVDGESLQGRIDRRGALSNDEIRSIGEKIAAGLHFAHSRGIVHRDLKPGNVLLDAEGRRVWIADFGLARPGGSSRTTGSGEISGTPSYMAPEQMEGGGSDPRSDLFALGATLYAMAVGQPPFKARSIAGILRRIVDHPTPSARAAKPDLDRAVDQAIQRLLRKDPEDRFQSAEELRLALAMAPSGSSKSPTWLRRIAGESPSQPSSSLEFWAWRSGCLSGSWKRHHIRPRSLRIRVCLFVFTNSTRDRSTLDRSRKP